MQKNPLLAWFLSFIYPGVGQIYNRQMGKGIIFLIIASILIASGSGLIFELLIVWPLSMLDAVIVARRINRKREEE